MPVFAAKVLHGDARTLGFLMGGPGLGAVVVGVALSSREKAASYRSTGAACALFGALLVAFSQTKPWGGPSRSSSRWAWR
jgi:hypothetical protein